jgi:hypothetical protein
MSAGDLQASGLREGAFQCLLSAAEGESSAQAAPFWGARVP